MKDVKAIRLKDYDYSTNGYYFVTICCDYKQPRLARLEGIVKEAVERLNCIKGVKVEYFCAMTNHLHLIIILDGCALRLGEVVRRLKGRVSKEAGFKVWQPNYYEHVIRNEKALEKIREYIQNNPKELILEFGQFYK